MKDVGKAIGHALFCSVKYKIGENPHGFLETRNELNIKLNIKHGCAKFRIEQLSAFQV